MKTINKFLNIGLAFTLAAGFISCSEKEADYDPAKPVSEDCPLVSFVSNSATLEFEDGVTTYDMNLVRKGTSGDLQVPIKVITNTDNAFEVPEFVQFKDGESTAVITVAYPNTQAGKTYSLDIQLDDKAYNPYTTNSYSSLTILREWVTLGWCIYRDDVVAPMYGAEPPVYYVKVQEKFGTKGYYRMIYPYGEVYPYNEPGDWDDSQDYNIIVDATDPDFVVIPRQSTGLDWGDGMFGIYDFASYYMDNGYTKDECISLGYGGKLKNGIITFPVRALLAPLGSSLYYANQNGAFYLDLNEPEAENPLAE